MAHFGLSVETLASYLLDLEGATAQSRNLFTEKYARIDNAIPPLKDNPLIGQTVGIQDRWMEALSERYPHTFGGRPGFSNYLSCELETYSDETLALYYQDMTKADGEGRNLAEEQYTWLFQRIGYDSIDEIEQKGGM